MRFTGMGWPADTLTCMGQAVRKHHDGTQNLVECELQVVNQRGEPVVTGEASVALPAKT